VNGFFGYSLVDRSNPESAEMASQIIGFATALMLLAGANVALAQQQTGEIYGRAADTSGALLPGTTVTVESRSLFQPRVAVTSEAGTYRIAELPIGAYSVTFQLTGFRTVTFQDIRVTIGFQAQVNATLEVSAVQESVTVTDGSPLVDSRNAGTVTSFDLETLQNIPSARDPWVTLERTPGIVMDRVNVGGNHSGQQSNYVSRGDTTTNNKWSMDGVDITDMTATGASPIYYDFDMFDEIQITTGGADVTQQTGGVGINLVTRNGTDRRTGNARFLLTDEELEGDNITGDLQAQGAGAGAPIDNIRDYGFDVGGPIKEGKAWYWASYATQKITTGVVGFYKNDGTCRPGGVSLDPATTDRSLLRDCLETDLTTLNNYNWKISWAPFANNRVTLQNTWAEKVRNARDASDTRPIETTYRQKAVSSEFGAFGWLTGPNPLWKIAGQQIISDRWLIDVMAAHVGNNFVLDFHEDALRGVQARQETTTGVWGRSFDASTFLRPTNSFDIASNLFVPARLGGDHSLKFGYRWRNAHSTIRNHHGGFIDALFTNGVASAADIWRDEASESHLDTHAVYVQDNYSRDKLTINFGLRLDRQDDSAAPTRAPENPFFPQLMPAVDFAGADAGVVWTELSPRAGITYDLHGNRETVLSASLATYYGQMSPGQLSNQLAAIGAVFVRYPWRDLNGDAFVQPGEVETSVPFLDKSDAYDPAHPASTVSPTRVDSAVAADRTRELIVGVDRQVGSHASVGVNYIWRRYDRFSWNDRDDWTSANYRAVNYVPAGCPAGARCEPIVYYEPTRQLPSANVYANRADRYRTFNGVEATFTRRGGGRWSMNASLAYNDAVEHFGTASLEDPTCVAESCPGEFQYAPESEGSGIGNVFQNSRWLAKVSGRVELPYALNVAANYMGRQGFPFPQSIVTPDRANGGATAQVLLDPIGAVRYDNLHTIDVRIDRAFRVRAFELVPSLDVFNLMNASTVLAINGQQAAANANTVSGILAPRVARVGITAHW
jgi:hypothetical protein